ncbi:MAG: hypothetical protein MZV64_18140 [Ignavibacteriales bacterium]|nr:hypothetical protein [Ignavibacteriales bacterium]
MPRAGQDQAAAAEGLHDLAQVRPGQAEGAGQAGDVGRPAAAAGEIHQGLDGVIGVLVDQFHRLTGYNDTN